MAIRTVSIGEAAQILRISTEAVRKRIKRGSLKAHKDTEGQWLVDLDEKAIEEIARERAEASGYYPGGNGQDGGLPDILRPSSRLEETLEEEVTFLREEISFLRQEIARLDTIIITLSQNTRMLEPARSATDRYQMSWWHRLKIKFLGK